MTEDDKAGVTIGFIFGILAGIPCGMIAMLFIAAAFFK